MHPPPQKKGCASAISVVSSHQSMNTATEFKIAIQLVCAYVCMIERERENKKKETEIQTIQTDNQDQPWKD